MGVLARDDLELGARMVSFEEADCWPVMRFLAISQNVRTFYCEKSQFNVLHNTVQLLSCASTMICVTLHFWCQLSWLQAKDVSSIPCRE
jgi:hypothetical protein